MSSILDISYLDIRLIYGVRMMCFIHFHLPLYPLIKLIIDNDFIDLIESPNFSTATNFTYNTNYAYKNKKSTL